MAKPVSLLFALAIAVSPAIAFAQDAHTEAQEKFAQGRAAMVRGDYKSAYESFKQSRALESGRGTLVNLAICEEALGLLVLAQQHFVEVLPELPSEDDRVPVVKEHINSLRTRVPHLRVDAAGAPAGATILVDDKATTESALDDLLLDPGAHVVIAKAPGQPDRRYDTTLGDGKRGVVKIIWQSSTSAQPSEGSSSGSGKRTAGFVIGGIGVAGLALGGITGAIALSDHGSVTSACPSQKGCSADVVSKASAGKTMSIVSTAGFAGGVLGVGIGAYLILSSKSAPAAPAVGWSMNPDGPRATFFASF
jgi:hypothetical protein